LTDETETYLEVARRLYGWRYGKGNEAAIIGAILFHLEQQAVSPQKLQGMCAGDDHYFELGQATCYCGSIRSKQTGPSQEAAHATDDPDTWWFELFLDNVSLLTPAQAQQAEDAINARRGRTTEAVEGPATCVLCGNVDRGGSRVALCTKSVTGEHSWGFPTAGAQR